MAKAKKEIKEPVTKPEEKEPIDGNPQEVSPAADETSTEAVEEVEQVSDEPTNDEKATAKAGKRSAKALKEAEAKEAKEVRKAQTKASEAAEAAKPKHHQKPPRSRLERQGKNFRKVAEIVDKSKDYSLAEALELATKTSPVKFDATVEMHVNLNVDPKQADQNVRDTVPLPAGTGKTVRIAVIADVDDAAAAKQAGADLAGQDEILKQLEKGVMNFDTLIATPAMMPKLGKYARLLGPKGLMPNPKSGTVTPDVAKAVQAAKAGRVEYRVDSTGIVHVGIGKVSFGKDKLLQNALAITQSLRTNKPASVKGVYVASWHVTTSMGPSIRVAPSEL